MSVTGLALSLLIAIVSISLCFLWKKVNQEMVINLMVQHNLAHAYCSNLFINKDFSNIPLVLLFRYLYPVFFGLCNFIACT